MAGKERACHVRVAYRATTRSCERAEATKKAATQKGIALCSPVRADCSSRMSHSQLLDVLPL
jgi:hypothetical protein